MQLTIALKPILVLSQIMGLNVNGRLGRAYTLTVFIAMISFGYASYIHVAGKDEDILTGVDSLIIWTQLVNNVIFVFVVLGVCIFRPGQFIFPVQDMRRIDIVFGFFGVEISDGYFYRIQSLQIFGTVLISTLLTCRDVYRAVQQSSLIIFMHWLHYSYVVSLSVITDCLFVDYLTVINKRFLKLNQLLTAIVNQNKIPTFDLALLYVAGRDGAWNKNTSTISNVERLRLLHHDLCNISRKVNRSFDLQLLCSTAISLVMITGQLYEAYHFIMMNDNPVEIGIQKIMWIVYYIGRLYYVSYTCNRTSHQASRASSIIYEMPVQQISSGVTNQIQHFSLQLLHENLNFNACGFFEIDCTLLCSIVGVVSTYLVILIQMDRKTQCIE